MFRQSQSPPPPTVRGLVSAEHAAVCDAAMQRPQKVTLIISTLKPQSRSFARRSHSSPSGMQSEEEEEEEEEGNMSSL